MEGATAKVQSLQRKPENMQVYIDGRVIEIWDYETRDGRRFGHIVQTVTNADDVHNLRRSRVIVTSDRKIAPVGVDVQLVAEMSGNVQSRIYTDRESGQKREFKDFRCYLNEVK